MDRVRPRFTIHYSPNPQTRIFRLRPNVAGWFISGSATVTRQEVSSALSFRRNDKIVQLDDLRPSIRELFETIMSRLTMHEVIVMPGEVIVRSFHAETWDEEGVHDSVADAIDYAYLNRNRISEGRPVLPKTAPTLR